MPPLSDGPGSQTTLLRLCRQAATANARGISFRLLLRAGELFRRHCLHADEIPHFLPDGPLRPVVIHPDGSGRIAGRAESMPPYRKWFMSPRAAAGSASSPVRSVSAFVGCTVAADPACCDFLLPGRREHPPRPHGLLPFPD